MSLAAFSVVLVPFPFADRDVEKVRPAVIVSRPELEQLGLFWAAMVTSTRLGLVSGDVPITALKEAGLAIPSRVRTAKLNALTPDRVLRRLGRLTPDDAQAVAAQTAAWLATPVRER